MLNKLKAVWETVREWMGNHRKLLYRCTSIFLILLMIGSAGVIVSKYLLDKRSGNEFDELQNMVNNVPVDNTQEGQEEGETSNGVSKDDTDASVAAKYEIITVNGVDIEVPIKNLDWDALHEINKDIYAWICVPGTRVDYPVLQHPTENDYYLHKTLSGEFSWDGNIYSQVEYNSKDFEDRHTVLYGHNRRSNGKMFRSLHEYENSYFFKIYPYAFIYTEKGVYIYQIFAEYQHTNVHLLANYTTNTSAELLSYLNSVVQTAELAGGNMRDIGEIEHLGRMLTMSTCVGDDDSIRYLVQALLIYEPGMEQAE